MSKKHLRQRAGAQQTLNAFIQHRRPQSNSRLPLVGLLCVILSFMIFAWGTSYKLSLYKPDEGLAPAKVCTRGSDVAKSMVSHAIDGRKPIAQNIVASLPVYASNQFSDVQSLGWLEALTVFTPLPSSTIRAARPPPVRFPFAS